MMKTTGRVAMATLAMIMTVGPLVEAGEFSFKTEKDKTLCVTGFKGEGAAVVIPAENDEVKVTAIDGKAFKGRGDVTSVTIPDTVVTIKKGKAGWHPFGAFSGCLKLKNVNFAGKNPAKIGGRAFFGTLVQRVP